MCLWRSIRIWCAGVLSVGSRLGSVLGHCSFLLLLNAMSLFVSHFIASLCLFSFSRSPLYIDHELFCHGLEMIFPAPSATQHMLANPSVTLSRVLGLSCLTLGPKCADAGADAGGFPNTSLIHRVVMPNISAGLVRRKRANQHNRVACTRLALPLSQTPQPLQKPTSNEQHLKLSLLNLNISPIRLLLICVVVDAVDRLFDFAEDEVAVGVVCLIFATMSALMSHICAAESGSW